MQISFFELPNHISRLILSATVLIVIISLYFNELKRVVTRREILLQVEICPGVKLPLSMKKLLQVVRCSTQGEFHPWVILSRS